jgi:hypothetical protein
MNTLREASCSCGQLVATFAGEPARVSACHCLHCKRRTGSAFSWTATYAESALVSTHGDYHVHTRINEEGHRGLHHFCPSCGNTVTYTLEVRPGMISVPAGAFADTDFPPPTVEVYGERRNSWCEFALQGLRQE